MRSFLLTICWLTVTGPLPVTGQVITSVIGTEHIFPATEIAGADAPLGVLGGMAKDRQGNIYVADQTHHMVMRVSPDFKVSIVAGNGVAGYSGDGHAATRASLLTPFGVAVDAAGVVYVADTGNHRIRRIKTDGIIDTIAGTGAPGAGLDGVLAVMSPINSPVGVAVDPNGGVYFSDTLNNRIRLIQSHGAVSTIAGSPQAFGLGDGGPAISAMFRYPTGLFVDSWRNLYVADSNQSRIRKITPAGQISTVAGNGGGTFNGDNHLATATALRFPYQAVVDPVGKLLIADHFNRRIRQVDSLGLMTTVAGTGQVGFSGDGGLATAATISFPASVIADGAFDFSFTDSFNGRIRRVRNGVIGTVAGNGGPSLTIDRKAQFTSLRQPNGLAFDGAEALFVVDGNNNRILRLSPTGDLSIVAGTGTAGFSGDGGPATRADVYLPENITVDRQGNLYIADFFNDRIRKVTPDGTIRTVVGTGAAGWSGDGVGVQVAINHPRGMTTDGRGNLYFADYGNARVRRLGLDGRVETIAGTGVPCHTWESACFRDGLAATSTVLTSPSSIATDGNGTFWVVETDAHRIRKFTLDGAIFTVAGTGVAGYSGDGGLGTSATLNSPRDIALDKNGNLYIVDQLNHRIRVLDNRGMMRTLAGKGQAGFSGDGGDPLKASFNGPSGIAISPSGDVYVSDSSNGRVRLIASQPPVASAVAPARFTFRAPSDAGLTAAQTIALNSSTPGLPFTVVVPRDAPWLTVSALDGILPFRLEVRANSTGLAPGTYATELEVRTPNAAPSVQKFPVTIVVGPEVPPSLTIDHSVIILTMRRGDAPVRQIVGLRVSGSKKVSLAVSAAMGPGDRWLKAELPVPAASAVEPGVVELEVDPSRVDPGTHTALVTVTANSVLLAGPGELKVRVNLIVTEAVSRFELPQTTIRFQAIEGGPAPATQFLPIVNTGGDAVQWDGTAKALDGSGWLKLGAESGSVSDVGRIPVTVVDFQKLRAGSYYGVVQLSLSGSRIAPQIATVQLTVLPPGSPLPPQIDPSSLVFAGVAGRSPSAEVVKIFNPTAQSTAFTSIAKFAENEVSQWLRHVPSNAMLPSGVATSVTVQPDYRDLKPGIYRGSIQFQIGGVVRLLDVTSVVTTESGEIPVDASSMAAAGAQSGRGKSRDAEASENCWSLVHFMDLDASSPFTATVGEPVTLTFKLLDACHKPAVAGGTKGAKSISPSLGFAGTSLEPPPPPISQGTIRATVTFPKMPDGGATAVDGSVIAYVDVPSSGLVFTRKATLPFTVQLSPKRDALPIVTRTISEDAGSKALPVSPGAFVSVFGENLATGSSAATGGEPYPTQLGETQVYLGKTALPLRSVSPQRIEFQVPADVVANQALELYVKRGDVPSGPFTVTVGGREAGAADSPPLDGRGRR